MGGYQVDVEEVIKAAEDLSRMGSEASTNIKNIYEAVRSLGETWYGFAYDGYAKALNQNVKALNMAIADVTKELPDQLAAIANDYADENDGSGARSAGLSDPDQVVEIDLTNRGTEYGFDPDIANTTKGTMDSERQAAFGTLGNMKGVLRGTNWVGAGANNTKERMSSEIDAIINMTDDAINAFGLALNAKEAEARAREAARAAGETVENMSEGIRQAMEDAKEAAEEIARKADEAATRSWINFRSFLGGGL